MQIKHPSCQKSEGLLMLKIPRLSGREEFVVMAVKPAF